MYVASPLGFFEAGRRYSAEVLLPAVVRFGLVPVDPWSLSPAPPDRESSGTESEFQSAIHGWSERAAAANALAIESSDAMLGVLDGSDVDSGTAAEIGFAAALGKLVVGLRTDYRRSGENIGVIVNLQVQYFVECTGGRIVTSLAEALELLRLPHSERLDVNDAP